MTNEQKAAYVFAQSVAATAAIEGMKAENAIRESEGKSLAYDGPAFLAVIEEYGIHHNGVLTIFHEWPST